MATILLTLLGLYVLATGIFLITENRRPQETLAWLLAFYFAPGIGLLIYFLFGRNRKAFSKRSKLLRQELKPKAFPILSPLLAQQDAEIARLEGESPSHKKLMMLVRRNSHSVLRRRTRVEILQDAALFYPRMVEDIKAARHSIHLQYFIWRADKFTEGLKELLRTKADGGIEVRLLYDPVGSRAPLIYNYLKEMRVAGVRVAPTSPPYQLHTISYRNHRKITVIDGIIGYTGGMNIGQEHLDGGKHSDCWRDTQLRLVGRGAALLQAVFMVDWYNAMKENLFSATYFPAEATDPADFGDSADDDVPVQILTSGPDSRWAAIRQLYSFMIVTAQRHVFLQSPYFILDASIAEALRSAALSGIDVRVMLSARESGHQFPLWAANTYIVDRRCCERGRSRFPVPEGLSALQDDQHRLQDLLDRFGEHGYPQLQHQL
jgi:cardiolipin synthase